MTDADRLCLAAVHDDLGYALQLLELSAPLAAGRAIERIRAAIRQHLDAAGVSDSTSN